MQKLIIFSALFAFNALTAQPPILWQASAGDMFYDSFDDVLVSPQGDIYAVGTTQFPPSTPGAKGLKDVLLAKYSSSGNLIWEKVYGGSQPDEGYSLVQMSNGNLVIVANSESSDGDVGGNNGNIDVWVFAVDTSGSIQWETNIGGSGFDRGKSIVITTTGLAVIYEKGAPERDFAISFLSNTGTVQSSHYYGSSCIDKCRSGIGLADGTFVLSGTVECADGNVSNVFDNEDVWLVKVDGAGQVIWEKTYGGLGADRPSGMVQGSDGRIYVSAESIYSSHDVPPLKGGYDLWYFAVDTADGSVEWSKTFGTTGNDYAGQIAEYNNQLYAVGTSGTNGGDLSGPGHGGQELWVFKLDTAGGLIWEANFGSSNNDKGFGVFVNGSHTLVTGYSGAGDGDVPSNNGSSDAWLLNLGAPVGLSEGTSGRMAIYPLPFRETLHLEVGTAPIDVRISNLNGAEVFHQTFDKTDCVLALEHLPAGVFILEVKSSSWESVSRIVKR